MKKFNFLILVFFFVTIYYNFKKYILFKEQMVVTTNHERPFVNVYGNNKDQLSIILLSHPFTRDTSIEQFEKYKKDKFLILGITSYGEFPNVVSNKKDYVLSNPKDKAWSHDYMKIVKGWLYCFRDPAKYISTDVPKLLLSESDFTNHNLFKPNPSLKKKYDFIYVCTKSASDCFDWASINKNWPLGYHCLKILCGKYNLKGLLIGRDGCELPSGIDKKNLEVIGFVSREELIKKYNESKFLFVPNIIDASPRVLSEGLCCNLPILVNSNILGGWKYVNEKTGHFFTNEIDIDQGIEYILKNLNNLQPRKYFIDNFGEKNSGKKLKKWIEQNFKNDINLDKYDYLTLN